jgi:hypothetical protein
MELPLVRVWDPIPSSLLTATFHAHLEVSFRSCGGKIAQSLANLVLELSEREVRYHRQYNIYPQLPAHVACGLILLLDGRVWWLKMRPLNFSG